MADNREVWGVITDLMDCVAAGRGEGEKQTLWAPQGIRRSEALARQYGAWVHFYRSWFGQRNYPLAQAFLNTDRGQKLLLPEDYLYGTAVIVLYQHQSVRVLHLLNSSRFLYFFTDRRWTAALQTEYVGGGAAIDQVWRSIAGAKRHDLGLELRQLAEKYSLLASKCLEVPGEADIDWRDLSTSRKLDRFIGQWRRLVELYAERASSKVGGAENPIDEPAVFGQFLLLDFFDLGYLLQLRKRSHLLQAWVKVASEKALEQGGFVFGANRDDKDFFELFCPTWAPPGLIESALVFPIASQAFYDREVVDDVFFVAFLAKGHDWTKAAPEVEGLRSIVNLICAASLNELRRLFVVDEARHSAVAAIMGRNMSHNIGSHVLHWLVQKERRLAHIGRLKRNKGRGEREERRAHFLTYLRERMEYIATVTRRVAWWYTTCSADSLLSPFVDKVRHLQGPPLDSLLESIGKSDSVKLVRIEAAEGEVHRAAFRGMNLAIPHGAAGRQAFYTIIENIVRNTAKYQQKRVANQDLVVTVDFREVTAHRDLIEVVIKDSATAYSEETVRKIERALRDPLTTSYGEPLMQQLGLKEMRISAAFLRGIDPSAADEIQDPDLIQLRDESGQLAHVFFLRKSRDVLLIAEQASEIPEAVRRRLEGLGVGFAAPEEVVRDAESGTTISSYRFRFLLGQEEFDWDRCREQAGNAWRWPLRTLQEAGNALVHGGIVADRDSTDRIRKLVDSLQTNGGEAQERAIARALKNEVYDAWLKHWHGENYAPRLVVYDQATQWLEERRKQEPHKFVIAEGSNPFSEGSREPLPDFSDGTTAVFTHHGVPAKMHPKLSKDLSYIETFSGGSTTAQLLLYTPGEDAEEFLVREMRETALTNLLIIDERIAGDTPPTPEEQQKRHCAGIELIGAEFLSMVERGGGSGVAIHVNLPEDQWPNHWLLREPPFMYMTIHYSLIQKIAERVDLQAEECAAVLVEYFQRRSNVVFIHSGRGRPDVPSAARFIDYSSLERWYREGKRNLVVGFGGL